MITLLSLILFVENLSILLFFAKEFKMETILEEVLDAVSNVLQEIEAKAHDLLVSKDKGNRTFSTTVENKDAREKLFEVLLDAGYEPHIDKDILSYTVPDDLLDNPTPVYLVSKNGNIEELPIYQKKEEYPGTGTYVMSEERLIEEHVRKLLKGMGERLCDDGWGIARLGSVYAVSSLSIVKQYLVTVGTDLSGVLKVYQNVVENALDERRKQFIIQLNQAAEEVEEDFLPILKALGTQYQAEGNHSWRIVFSNQAVKQNGILVIDSETYVTFLLTAGVEDAIVVMVLLDSEMSIAEKFTKYFVGGTKDYRIRRSTIINNVFFIE